MTKLFRRCLIVAASALFYTDFASAAFLDARGHYVISGETRTAPAMAGDTGLYQAIEQNFRLEGEVRLDDASSVILELRLFDNPRQAYLGDTPQPRDCPARNGETSCSGRHQSVTSPGYAGMTPKITKAYVRYGFEYCMLEAGRRGRDWGLGIFLDSGEDPFETGMSVFDGVTCEVNIQKAQTLGFSLGFDKLSETGTYPYHPRDNLGSAGDADQVAAFEADEATRSFGANTRADDLGQFYFTLEYDNGKLGSKTDLNYQVGIYFANIFSTSDNSGLDSGTDVKFFDFYYDLFYQGFSFRNEFIVRQGKTGDPNIARLGGSTDAFEAVRNDVASLALAGLVEWEISSGGSIVGPPEYREGNLHRHLLFFDYAIAPGTQKGYYSTYDAEGNLVTDPSLNEVERTNQGSKTAAAALHENYKPALIFFNGKPQTDGIAVDGIFDPYRVMNVSLYGLGYRYEDLENGNFEVKVISGQLGKSIPDAVKAYYNSKGDGYRRPIGFYGKDLGYEIDFKYTKALSRFVDLGLAAAYTLPGKAWQTLEGESPRSSILAQSYLQVKF